MNLTAGGRQTAAALAATTKMIVVRADDNYFLFQKWIRTFQHADDVVSRNFGANYVSRETYFPRYRAAAWRPFNLGERRTEKREQTIRGLTRNDEHWQSGVAGGVVVSQSGQAIVFKVWLARDDDECFRTSVFGRNGFPAHAFEPRESPVRIAAVRRALQRDRDPSARVWDGVVVVVQLRSRDAVTHIHGQSVDFG